MELRKRKRVDYNNPKSVVELKSEGEEKHAPIVKKTKKTVMNNSNTVSTSSSTTPGDMSNTLENTQNVKHIINNVVLQRPPLKTDTNKVQQDNQTASIETLQEYLSDLSRLTQLQQGIYFEDLKEPQMLGPKHFKHLKFPDDMMNLRKISHGLNDLIKYRAMLEEQGSQAEEYHSKQLSEDRQRKLVSIATHKDIGKVNSEDVTALIATIHGIDSTQVRDIKCNRLYINGKINFDPDYVNINEIKSICKKIDKPLLREKNNNLTWPTRMKKKKINKIVRNKPNDNSEPNPKESHPAYKFRNVPLFNSI
ncbi:hypothetical protein MOUN0_O03686 [Monosporozyma unispora]|nr:hypothetical protein C6P44_002928 [Kazachstania unispora]